MNSQDNSLNSIHDSFIAILDMVQRHYGRDAARRLLMRIQYTFDTSRSESVAQSSRQSISDGLNTFIQNGGYSLVEQNIYIEIPEGTYQALAFGILSAANTSPTLAFLLRYSDTTCYQVEFALSDLGHYSSVRHPLFGHTPTFTFLTGRQSVHNHVDVPKLIQALADYGAKELAEAVSKVYQVQVKVTDDVPEATLVPLTDDERDTLPAIPGIEFSYMGRDDELIRIQPAGRDGYAFFTRHQAVELSARNVDVSKYLKPGNQEVWLLRATPHASHAGVSLHAVMSLTEDDPRRAEYLPLIDVFIQQTLEHAQRQPKQH